MSCDHGWSVGYVTVVAMTARLQIRYAWAVLDDCSTVKTDPISDADFSTTLPPSVSCQSESDDIDMV